MKSGAKTAIQACKEVFTSAQLTAAGGTTVSDQNNTVAKAVLHNFHELHRSWAREQTIFVGQLDSEKQASEPWLEDSPMGAYVTRALLSPNYTVDSVLQGTEYLQPIRSNMSPPHTYQGIPSTTVGSERDWRLGTQHPFAGQGELLGIQTVSIPPIFFFPAVRFTNLSSMPDFPNIGVAPTATAALTSLNLPDITSVQGPLTGITDQFAILIKGNLQITNGGSYTLFLNVDDGGSLTIDGTKVINRTSVGESSFVISLAAGSHPISVEYRQMTGTAKLIMSWQGPGIPSKVAVPTTAFTGLTASYYTQSQPPPLQITGSEGGGFIGNHNYLMTTYMSDTSFVPDGAVSTNRSWARAVLADTLCREIPVIRDEDAQPFVVATSNTPFRQYSACSRCHATADRMASLVNPLKWNHLPTLGQTSPLPTLMGMLDVRISNPSLPAALV